MMQKKKKIKELEESNQPNAREVTMPFEMPVTMLGSTVLGGVMSIWSQSIKAKQAEQRDALYKKSRGTATKVLKQQRRIRERRVFNGLEEL